MTNSIYSKAKTMTTQEMQKGLGSLNTKETATYQSLVRLGDSKALALQTVLADRSKDSNNDFYYNAYCI